MDVQKIRKFCIENIIVLCEEYVTFNCQGFRSDNTPLINELVLMFENDINVIILINTYIGDAAIAYVNSIKHS